MDKSNPLLTLAWAKRWFWGRYILSNFMLQTFYFLTVSLYIEVNMSGLCWVLYPRAQLENWLRMSFFVSVFRPIRNKFWSIIHTFDSDTIDLQKSLINWIY